MKLRTWRYMLKEGVKNTYRNKFMSLASLGIVITTLIIFGVFFLVAMNLNTNLESLTAQPELEIFIKSDAKEDVISAIEGDIKANPKIDTYEKISKEQALARAKKMLGESASLLDGEDPGFMNVSFIIKVGDHNHYDEIVQQYKKLPDVESVQHFSDTIKLIEKVAYWVNIVSIVLLSILLLSSVFIISNTIKLTVFARRKEIGIMKCVGATDWFIRWPFIIEGVIIGIIGAAISFSITAYGYAELGNRFDSDFLSIGNSTFTLLGIADVGFKVIMIYTAIGIFVGSIGSSISLHKHLKV